MENRFWFEFVEFVENRFWFEFVEFVLSAGSKDSLRLEERFAAILSLEKFETVKVSTIFCFLDWVSN